MAAKKATSKKRSSRKASPSNKPDAGEAAPVRQAGRVTFSGGRSRGSSSSASGGGGREQREPREQTKSSGDFQRRAPERPENPRRVRGGIKLDAKVWPPDLSIFAAPVVELIDELIDRPTRDEAFNDYAMRGQTRSIDVQPARIDTLIQGRRYKPYNVTVHVRPFDAGEWDRLIAATDDEPLLPAKLLAGEMPPEALAFAESHGLALHPTADEVSRTTDSKEAGAFDKHAACALMLAAEMIHRDPFLLFALRGMTREELNERLRQRRAVTSSSSGFAAAYAPQPLPEAEQADQPLDAELDRFYDAGPQLRELELPLRKPDISHPLLRRLGPSPFDEGRFPLVGLLATCYDTISTHALRTPDEDDADTRPPAPSTPGQPTHAEPAGDPGDASSGDRADAATNRVADARQAPRSKPKAKAKAKAKAKPKTRRDR